MGRPTGGRGRALAKGKKRWERAKRSCIKNEEKEKGATGTEKGGAKWVGADALKRSESFRGGGAIRFGKDNPVQLHSEEDRGKGISGNHGRTRPALDLRKGGGEKGREETAFSAK